MPTRKAAMAATERALPLGLVEFQGSKDNNLIPKPAAPRDGHSTRSLPSAMRTQRPRPMRLTRPWPLSMDRATRLMTG